MKPALSALAVFFLLAGTLPSQPPAAQPEFATQILPILQTSCYPCHSGNRPPGGLRLDARSFAMRAITPGNAAASRLIQRVEGADGEPQMPFGLTPLPPQQIAAPKNLDQPRSPLARFASRRRTLVLPQARQAARSLPERNRRKRPNLAPQPNR